MRGERTNDRVHGASYGRGKARHTVVRGIAPLSAAEFGIMQAS